MVRPAQGQGEREGVVIDDQRLRVTVDRGGRRVGSLWVNGVELELHAVDEERFFAGLAEAYCALQGREHVRMKSEARLAPILGAQEG